MLDQKKLNEPVQMNLPSVEQVNSERNSLLYRLQNSQMKSRQSISVPVAGGEKNGLPINIDTKSKIYSELSSLIKKGYFIEAESKEGRITFSIRHLSSPEKAVSVSLYEDNKVYGAGNYRDAGSFKRLLEYNLAKEIKKLHKSSEVIS